MLVVSLQEAHFESFKRDQSGLGFQISGWRTLFIPVQLHQQVSGVLCIAWFWFSFLFI
jgi:hypothetical protein